MKNIFITCSVLFFLNSNLFAQEIFVKATDNTGTLIPGESVVSTHPNEIAALNFGQESSPCPSTTPGCGIVTGNFVFNMIINKSINTFRRLMYLNLHLNTVDIVFRKTGPTPMEYYKIHLENVIVTNVHDISDATAGSANTFQISLDPQKFHWTYIPQLSTGALGTPIKFGYDKLTNTEFIF